MTPLRVALALVLVMVAMLLVAGCAGQPGDRTSAANGDPSNTAPTLVPSGYWIRIDPISEKKVGDNLTVTATTNLPAEEKIHVQIFSSGVERYIHLNHPAPWEWMGGMSTVGNVVNVVPGNNGINTTLFVVGDTSWFEPDEYIVGESTVDEKTSNGTSFILYPDFVLNGNITLKPGNLIEREKLDLPPFVINNSIRPVFLRDNISLSRNPSQKGQLSYGSIIVFLPDQIVRCFDKNGTQYATYFGFRVPPFDNPPIGSPPGARIERPIGNVTMTMQGNERILTEIFEVGGYYY
jgi:hypothetical protein